MTIHSFVMAKQKAAAQTEFEELLDEQINVTVSKALLARIKKIKKHHGYSGAYIGRMLLEAACDFYDRNGFLHFPIIVVPEPIQGYYISELKDFLTKAEAAAKKNYDPGAGFGEGAIRDLGASIGEPK